MNSAVNVMMFFLLLVLVVSDLDFWTICARISKILLFSAFMRAKFCISKLIKPANFQPYSRMTEVWIRP